MQNAAFEDAAGGLFQISLENWARAFDTNMLGALRLLRAVVPVMLAAGSGSVVLMGSQAARRPSLPQSGYAASKGALLSASYHLADELGRTPPLPRSWDLQRQSISDHVATAKIAGGRERALGAARSEPAPGSFPAWPPRPYGPRRQPTGRRTARLCSTAPRSCSRCTVSRRRR